MIKHKLPIKPSELQILAELAWFQHLNQGRLVATAISNTNLGYFSRHY
ncbi:MAG: hypothetical protein ACRCUZ_15905 [Shewanella sp.]